jgi:hypothetical protein
MMGVPYTVYLEVQDGEYLIQRREYLIHSDLRYMHLCVCTLKSKYSCILQKHTHVASCCVAIPKDLISDVPLLIGSFRLLRWR